METESYNSLGSTIILLALVAQRYIFEQRNVFEQKNNKKNNNNKKKTLGTKEQSVRVKKLLSALKNVAQ